MDSGEGDGEVKKQHRARKAGPKAVKKSSKRAQEQAEAEATKSSVPSGLPTTPDEKKSNKPRNPKAFALQHPNKTARAARRTLDRTEKQLHIPLPERDGESGGAPICVAVVGPARVGKTSLMRSLVRHFTHHAPATLRGPVTCVATKKKRVTLIECGNDLNSMIDVAKVCDLALLLVDASFGFEMEHFEFLNVCAVHGQPRVMGVLTHLDLVRDGKRQRRLKKRLKHRFWTELYAGAKLFYLSSMRNGEYLRHEVSNLSRFICVMKMHPIPFRLSHAHILVDRFEDVTSPTSQTQQEERRVAFYGYVRGTALRRDAHIHVAGLGDFNVHSVDRIDDPCALPNFNQAATGKRRSLSQKERVAYAPFSGLGGVVYDRDAVYIELGGSHTMTQQAKAKRQPRDVDAEGEEEASGTREYDQLLAALRESETEKTVEDRFASQSFQLFSDSQPITNAAAAATQRRRADFSMDVDVDESEKDGETVLKRRGEQLVFDDSDSDASECPMYEGESEWAGAQVVDDTLGESSAHQVSVWKRAVERGARDAAFQPPSATRNRTQCRTGAEWNRLLYGNADAAQSQPDRAKPNEEDNETSLIGSIFVKRNEPDSDEDERDCEVVPATQLQVSASSNAPSTWLTRLVRDRFVQGEYAAQHDARTRLEHDNALMRRKAKAKTGKPVKRSAKNKGKDNASDGEDDLDEGNELDDEEMDVDDEDDDEDEAGSDLDDGFIDLEAVENQRSSRKRSKSDKDTDGGGDALLDRKKKLKEAFNAAYDESGQKIAEDPQETEALKPHLRARSLGPHFDALKAEKSDAARVRREELSTLDASSRNELEGFVPGTYVRVELHAVPAKFVDNFDPAYPLLIGALQLGETQFGYVQARFKRHRWYSRLLKTNDPLIMSVGWRRFQTIPLYSIQDHNMRNRSLKYTPQHMHCHATFYGPIAPVNSGVLAFQDLSSNPHFRVAGTGVIVELDKSFKIVKKLKLVGHPFKIFKKTAFIRDMFTSKLEVARFEGACIRTVSGVRGLVKRVLNEPSGAFRATFEDKILLSDIVFMRTWFRLTIPNFYLPVTNLTLPIEDRSSWHGMRTVGQLRHDLNLPREQKTDSVYKPVERNDYVSLPLTVPNSLQRDLPFRFKPKTKNAARDEVASNRVAVIREPHERKIDELMRTVGALYDAKEQKLRAAMVARARKHKEVLRKEEEKQLSKRKTLLRKVYAELGKDEMHNYKKVGANVNANSRKRPRSNDGE